jgi:threonine/homoserine/homoserine lactone efflux protein
MLAIFLRSMFIGLAIAAPVGPIGVLCIRRTLANGRISGLVSGLGAATADAIYGSIAAFGLTFLATWLVDQQFWLRLVGGLFLAYLGLTTLLKRPSPPAPDSSRWEGTPQPSGNPGGEDTLLVSSPNSVRRGPRALASDYSSTLALTLTNPMTILSFAAIFAGIGIGAAGTPAAAALMVAGVFTGSALWWLVLSAGADLLRVRFLTPGGLLWVNRISGAIILAYGVVALTSLLVLQ